MERSPDNGGYYLGSNWREIGGYLGTYSEAVTGLIVVLAVFFHRTIFLPA